MSQEKRKRYLIRRINQLSLTINAENTTDMNNKIYDKIVFLNNKIKECK